MKRNIFLPILIVSLSQIARAIDYTSIATGAWDDPNSWDLTAAPDVYSGDKATIVGPHVINYNGLGNGFAGGNLVVGNGGEIVIDGGSLTQTWAPGVPPAFGTAIAIGAVAGPVSGDGTMTISNGGLFNSGTANVVGVGVSLGGPVGNGLVNIQDGTFRLGAASSAVGGQGLGVGIDTGATGVVNVGDGAGVAGSAVLDLSTNNAILTIGGKLQMATGGNGTVTVNGDGSLTAGAGTISIARDASSTGLLEVKSGGTLTIGSGAIIAGGSGNVSATFKTAGTVTSGGEIRIGGTGGTGALIMTGGAVTTTGEFNVGRGAGATGTATLSAGAFTSGQLEVGREGGNGTLTNSGATTVVNGQIFVGNDAGSTGTLTISSGSVANNNNTRVGGNGATGDVYISGGALNSGDYIAVGADGGVGHVHQTGGTVTFNSWVSMGLGGGGSGSSWDISGGAITSGAGLEVGSDRGATMTISGSANINVGSYNIGVRTGGNGIVTMTGGTLNAGGVINVGGAQSAGTGTMTVSGGIITSGGDFRVGQGSGANGTLNVTAGATLTANGEFQIGNNLGTGVMNMTGGSVTANSWAAIGRDGGTGTLNLSGGTITKGPNNGSFDVGVFGNGATLGTGHFNQTGGSFVNTVSDTNIGRDSSGVGTWDMSAGTATLTGRNLIIGNQGTGTATFTGGSISGINQLNVGGNAGSHGSLSVNYPNATDTLPFNELYVAYGPGSTGVINVTKGKLDLGGWSEIGRNGANGTVNITGANASFDGSGSDMQIGYGGGAIGAVNVTNGGTFSHNWWINLGRSGDGAGTFKVDGAGSNATQNDGRLNVGGDPNDGNGKGSGVFEVSNGGTFVKHGGHEVNLGTNTTSVGTLNVISGGQFTSDGGDSRIGRNGGSGTINVSGAGSLARFAAGGGENFLIIGNSGGTGVVNVSNGGAINIANGWFGLGDNSGSTGTATVSGAGSSITSKGLIVGWNGLSNGVLNIFNNGVVNQTGRELSVGRDNGGANSPTGTINIATGGVLNSSNDVRIGHNAKGILNINGGTLNSNAGWSIIGDGGTSNGTVNLTNGTFNNPNDTLFIGNNPGAVGTFNQNGAGSYTNVGGELNLARDRSFGTLNVNGGTFNVNGWTTIGRDNNGNAGGMGTINVTNGGIFQHLQTGGGDLLLGWKGGSTGAVNINTGGKVNYNWWIRTAVETGAKGDIAIDGAGSQLNTIDGRVFIGESGVGSLSITNGGKFNKTGGDEFTVGGNNDSNSAGNGTLLVDGAGSLLSNNEHIRIGRGNNGATRSVGVATVSNGGTISAGNWFGVGHDGGQGTLNMSGATSSITSSNEFYVGIDDNGHATTTLGTANITGGSITTTNGGGGGVFIGRNGGVGVVSITGSTTASISSANTIAIGVGGIGSGGSASTGTLNISNPNATVSAVNDIYVGQSTGTGTINQLAGVVSGNIVRVAQDAGSSGTINANGGTIFANAINIASGGGNVNFGGGGFRAKSDGYNPFVNFTTANSELNAGGVTIDTNGKAVSWSNTFDGVGAITKTGNGNLLIPTQAASHAGGYVVNQGSLTINETSTLGTGDVVINGGRVVLAPMGAIEGRIANNSFDTTTPNPGGATRISQDRANSTDAGAFIDNSTWVYTGKFNVPGVNSVNWTFAEQFDDGVYLTVDGNAGIINDNTWNNPTKATVTLTPGVHTFEVRLGQGGGGVGPNNGWAVGFGYDPQGRDSLDPSFYQPFSDTSGTFIFHDFAGTTTLANKLVLGAVSSEVNVPISGLTSQVNGQITGVGGLTKTGNGLLLLNNATNNYGNKTTISGGTLKLAASGVVPDTSRVDVAASGATFDLNSNAETVGSLASVTGSTVLLSAALTVGGDNTSSTVAGAITGIGSLTKLGNGTMTISGVQNYPVLNANAGTTTLLSSLANATLNNNGGTLNVNANANNSTVNVNAITNFGAAQALAALNVGTAGLAKISLHTGGPGNIIPIDTPLLSISGGGKLDLTNNVLVVRGGTFATIRNQVVSGFNGGSWDGAGINSSTAANDPLGLLAVGVVNNVDLGYGSFGNVNGLTGPEILVKTTYYGDSDLSGTVTSDDFSLFLDGFTGAAPASWLNGDYDYNGVVTSDDFSLFLASFTSGGAPQAPNAPAASGGSSGNGPAPIPEPGSIGLLVAGAFGILARRRRDKKSA